MDGNVIVIGALVVAAIGLVLAAQVLARVVAGWSFEPPWRPLATSQRLARTPSPPELAQLEAIVADLLGGDPGARRRLIDRLAVVGVPLPVDASAQQVLDALQRLERAQRVQDTAPAAGSAG
ncbi:MAG: hypothetical protein R2755_01830 [Acidimicrobiales bacterium]